MCAGNILFDVTIKIFSCNSLARRYATLASSASIFVRAMVPFTITPTITRGFTTLYTLVPPSALVNYRVFAYQHVEPPEIYLRSRKVGV